MSEDWVMRTYKKGDETKIVELLDTAFYGWHSVEFWNWKYKQNADGFFPNLIVLAEAEKEFAGHYTIIPARMKIGDNIILGSQSVDTATHPNHRRKGIFEKLANETYSNAVKNNIPITYGFAAVGPSYYGLVKKLNWHHINFLMSNEYIVDPHKAIERHYRKKLPKLLIKILIELIKFRNKMKMRIQIPEGVNIKEVESFDKRMDEFWEVIMEKNFEIMVVKDCNFLNWRLKRPDRKYVSIIAEDGNTILGYIILAEGIEDERIVDLQALPGKENVIEYLVIKAIEDCRKKNKDMLRCLLPKGHKYIKILKRIGFLIRETEMTFEWRLNIPDKELEKKIRTINKWNITSIDSDHE